MMLAISRWCEQYIIPAISVVGIVCNLLNLLVLSQKHMKESPYTYLMGLAVTDMCVLIISLVQRILARAIHCQSYVLTFYNAYVFIPVGNVFANSSIWITVLLTIERWISVRFPLQTKDVCTRKLARRAILVTILASSLLNSPRFFANEVQELPNDNSSNTTRYSMAPSEFGSGSVFSAIVVFYVLVILTVPCAALILLNSCLVCMVVQARHRRSAMQQQSRTMSHHERVTSRDQTRLTITCISIIALFVVCMTPSAFVDPHVVGMMVDEGGVKTFQESRFWQSLRTISNTLVICNLSLNFLLYCLFNNKFRQTLAHLLRECVACACCYRSSRARFSRRSSTSSTSYPYGSRHAHLRGSRRSRMRLNSAAHVHSEVQVCVEVHPMQIRRHESRRSRADDT